MRSPLSTPAGTFTARFFFLRIRPWPRQVSQGWVITWPRPLQRGQVCWTAKNPLLHADLAGAVAGLAGHDLGVRRGAAALACLAFAERREFDFGVVAEHCLLEIELEVVAQIGAAKDLPPAAPTAAEDVAEHVAEDVAESVGRAEAATAARSEPLMTVLIVDRALLLVGQDFVGFLALLELVFGLVIVRDCDRGEISSPGGDRLS